MDKYCNQFSQLVFQGVIDARWVSGVEKYLRTNTHKQSFVLVSATPEDELNQILKALNLRDCFIAVFGAPTRKNDAIRMILADRGLDPSDCLMIGDADADQEAAEINRVPFLLRRHETNTNIFTGYTGASVKDFLNLWIV